MHGGIPEPVLAELETWTDEAPRPVGRMLPQLIEQARQRDELLHALLWLYTCILGEELIAADIQCMVVAGTAISNACRGEADPENRIRDAHGERVADPPLPDPVILRRALDLLREVAGVKYHIATTGRSSAAWAEDVTELLALADGDRQDEEPRPEIPDQPKGT